MCILKLLCWNDVCLMEIFRWLINSSWFPSQEVSTARCLSPGGSVISVPRSEALTITVSLTDYKVDLPQPCHPTGCFANTFTSFCKFEDHRLGTQDVVPECLGNHSCNSASSSQVSFYSCDDTKGWTSFFLGDKMWQDYKREWKLVTCTLQPLLIPFTSKRVCQESLGIFWFSSQNLYPRPTVLRSSLPSRCAMPIGHASIHWLLPCHAPDQLELWRVCKPHETLAAAGDQWKALSNWTGLQLHQPCGHHELCTAIRRCATCTLAFF